MQAAAVAVELRAASLQPLSRPVSVPAWRRRHTYARMRIAAVEVRGAATDVREAGAPAELEEAREQLADRLLALSEEIAATVATLESFPDQLQKTSALNFIEWNAVQAELRDLRRQGVSVPLLERHQPELKRQ